MRKFVLFVYFIICLLKLSYSKEINFKYLSVNDGLLSNNITSICQDSHGYMWFGTENGLNKYDGYNIISFIHNPLDTSSLSFNNVVDIIEDTIPGNLWIATYIDLNYYDATTGRFHKMAIDLNNDNNSVANRISKVFWNSDSHLWIGTSLYLICVNNRNEHISLVNSNRDDKFFGIINDMVHWKGNDYFLAASNGLYKVDIKKKTSEKIKQGRFKSIVRDQNQNYWFGTFNSGLWFLNDSNKLNFENWTVENGKLKSSKITAMAEDSKGDIWILLDRKGIEIYSIRDQSRQFLSYDIDKRNGLNSSSNKSIFVDKQKNIWIGSHDAGVGFYDIHKKDFNQHQYYYSEHGFKNRNIRSLYQDSDGDIWIGKRSDAGLSRFDRKTESFTHYFFNTSDPNSLNDENVLCFEEASPGMLWIGTLSGGLKLFNKSTGKITQFKNKTNDLEEIPLSSIYALYKDSKDRLWVGTGWRGLQVFDKNLNKILCKDSSFVNTLSNPKIRSIYEDQENSIWIGTNNGLNRYDEISNSFKNYMTNVDTEYGAKTRSITHIYEDTKERLWISTNSNGLVLFDRQNDTLHTYTTNDGLADNHVYSIVEDDSGDLWLSTVKGMSKFVLSDQFKKIPNANFRNYNAMDGLHGKELSLNPILKLASGEILYGSSQSINIFNPNEIKDNQQKPDIHFTNFKLFNKSVEIGVPKSPLQKHINSIKYVELNHKQSIFSISYVAINYSSTKKNQYAYILEGFESEWNYVGNKMEATYTNLNAGTYTFRVKASNNDGLWNEEGIALVINVLPPPWLTWWAYIAYFLGLIGLLLLLWYYTIKRVQEQKEHEQSQQKLKFFMNVSHEFRTPLTLILNPVNRILNSTSIDESKDAANNIKLSANKLMNLVNQLLDFRKTDLGQLPLKAVNTDIVSYSKNIFELFEELGQSKKQTLNFTTSHQRIETWFDPDKYDKILNNLLSNAIKFTPTNGNIQLSITKKQGIKNSRFSHNSLPKSSKNYVEIKVHDSGIGLDKSQTPRVFDRFYSADDTLTGTGIGLNYTKSLVELHGGTISVQSQLGKGSIFTVVLPLGNTHLKNTQISKAEFSLANHQFEMNQLESLKYDIETIDEEIDGVIKGEGTTDELNRKQLVILLVEDNRKLRLQLRNELKNDYSIKEAINGEDGLVKAEHFFPDLIISDVVMPKMDGIEMCRKLKSDLKFCHIPIIMLTAKNLVADRIEGYKTGADHYMEKPFHMSELKVRINNIFDSQKRMKKKYQTSNNILNPSEVTQNNKDELFLEKVTQIALDNISNPEFTYNELQQQTELSRTAFYRKISALTSMSPGQFLHAIRIKHAASLMLKTEYSIKEICFKVGYKSQPYFYQNFRKIMGNSPMEYVKEQKKKG